MALNRRAKVTAGVIGLTATAFLGVTGAAFASDGDGAAQLVIVEQAHAPAVTDAGGDCAGKGSTTSTVADSR
jgi:hypothetical protein